MKTMRKMIALVMVLALALMGGAAAAGNWEVPGGSSSSGGGGYVDEYYINVKLIDDLATRSGPGTQYTGCGSYRMKGQYVKALSRGYDKGGVMWVEIEFSYGNGTRRAWTGAKRLNITEKQLRSLPDGDPVYSLGTGTITGRISPRFGPGTFYAPYGDRDFNTGTEVAVILEKNGFYMVERYFGSEILRCYVPVNMVRMR